MNSIWTRETELPHFPPLEGSIRTDVLIVGGGIAGILCAYFLQEKGVDYVLTEGRTICSGITKNTTAKITSQHGLIYQNLLNSAGTEKAALYLRANQESVEKYAELCEQIDCDFQRQTAYVYSLDNRRKLEREAGALAKIGFQAQFHTLKFLSHIAANLKIYENTLVKEFKENTAVTGHGSTTFKKAVFATHFPMDNKHGMYFLKLYQHRSYVISLKNCFAATGFNKWGITSAMKAALLLTDLILERGNPYEEVFHPSRSMIKPQLFLNGWEAAKNLLTISPKRCSHIGCALKWNGQEHSWDCPCHGSRFDEKGRLLDNPANGNLT